MKQKNHRGGYLSVLMYLLPVLLWSSLAFAAEAERTYQEDGHFYVIHFNYDPEGMVSIPAVRGAHLHYGARITVYEVLNGQKVEISSFGGQYTEKGCFEDDPKTLVEQARKNTDR